MSSAFRLVPPGCVPPLDPGFRPAALADRGLREEIRASGAGVPLVIALERADGAISRYETIAFPDGHPRAGANLLYAERLVKFLLWARGGWKLVIGGPAHVGAHVQAVFAPGGARAFDVEFMGGRVYQRPFVVSRCAAHDVPEARETGEALGRHLEGCRIGFDLGASDLKISAVIDGEAVFSDEIVWHPAAQSDPAYHRQMIVSALRLAQAKMPRLDAIGGSSAGVYVHNQPMVATLFRGVPAERFGEIRAMFLRIGEEFGVPLEVINDGDVTALAGAMSLEDTGVLGLAMGSSEAAGYVNLDGAIAGWLNELAFAPIDYSPSAPLDEWSGDRGVGAQYFSQQCVFRLAPSVGITLPTGEGVSMAAQLRHVQTQLEAGHEGAVRIWETIGVYLGYALAHYAGFYDLKHVLILGRVTSGRGGPLILERAKAVLAAEFPDLAGLDIRLPDEKTRRVGQSIAAASLPAIRVEGERSGASSEVRAERSELGGVQGAPPLKKGR
jgi:predicted NBD/HSP70 family sugar kinase